MAGHNRWTQIKRKKEKTDGQKSKVFSKFARLITQEAKLNGPESPSLKKAIERAKEANMPSENIARAIKKASESGSGNLKTIIYEAYGPGKTAILIVAMTDNSNRASTEIKTILAKNGLSLATPGSASWAFRKEENIFIPNIKIALSDDDLEKLLKINEALEESDGVQDIFTNAE